MDSEVVETKAPWTIKAMDIETRRMATTCAQKQGLTVAEWLDRAVRTQAQVDEGNRIEMPSAGGGRSGKVYFEVSADQPARLDLGGFNATGATLAAMEGAGIKVPRSITRELFRGMRNALLAEQGLPLTLPGKPPARKLLTP